MAHVSTCTCQTVLQVALLKGPPLINHQPWAEFAYFLSFVPEPDVSTLAAMGSDEVRPDAVGSGVPDSSDGAPERGACCWEGSMLDVFVLLKICCQSGRHEPACHVTWDG